MQCVKGWLHGSNVPMMIDSNVPTFSVKIKVGSNVPKFSVKLAVMWLRLVIVDSNVSKVDSKVPKLAVMCQRLVS